MVSIGDNKYLYNDLYIYLKTLEKATYKDNKGNKIVKWNLVKYPVSLINNNMNQNTKDKKSIILDKKQRIILLKAINYILPVMRIKILLN